ncbi:MAG TPA: HupE/UreJ family protein [Verrucomicrobiae bacterium]|nr:HupE/UreJ family protein [Verrucomicrobiae bacterium]
MRLPHALVLVAALATGLASAHPISQGSLAIRIEASSVVVEARVPVEEVFVASALGTAPAHPAASPWAEHGEYFLRHLQITADGRALSGAVRRVVEPGTGDSGFARYNLEYPLAAPPSRVSLTQDVLREIEYAPGNPWEATYVARVESAGVTAQDGLLLTSARPLTIDLAAPTSSSFPQYLRHGIEHILGGYDHLLFICALVLTAASFGDLIKVVSAFTLAHSITLTLSVLDIVRLPSRIVEPMIAASIVVVALSNVFWPDRTKGWTKLGMAFFFGLFHGLGFAGGLLDAMQGMPGAAVGVAITGFSAGVEVGHQMIVLPLFFLLSLARAPRLDAARRDRLSRALVRGGSIAISVAGAIYFLAAMRVHVLAGGMG